MSALIPAAAAAVVPVRLGASSIGGGEGEWEGGGGGLARRGLLVPSASRALLLRPADHGGGARAVAQPAARMGGGGEVAATGSRPRRASPGRPGRPWALDPGRSVLEGDVVLRSGPRLNISGISDSKPVHDFILDDTADPRPVRDCRAPGRSVLEGDVVDDAQQAERGHQVAGALQPVLPAPRRPPSAAARVTPCPISPTVKAI